MDFTIKSGVTKMNFNKITELLTLEGKEVSKESVMKGALHSEDTVSAVKYKSKLCFLSS